MNLDLGLKNFKPNELDIKKIGSWPLFLRIIIITTSFFSALIFGYQYINTDMQTKISNTQESINNAKVEYKKTYAIANQLEQYQNQSKELQIQYDKLIEKIPKENQTAKIIGEISRLALSKNLISRSILPKEFVKKDLYNEIPIEISFEGSYQNLTEFISELSSSDYFITTNSFSLNTKAKTTDENNPELILKMTIINYWRDS